jgi:hypothetical protein
MLCKIWDFRGSDYEEFRLLGYKNPVRTSQETHCVSTTECSQLMLCKTWDFHGSDYEECRLLGYKNPVRTTQETHYLSATESCRLMLCKFWDFRGSDYEDCRLLGCYAVWLLLTRATWRNIPEDAILHKLSRLRRRHLVLPEGQYMNQTIRCNMPQYYRSVFKYSFIFLEV